MSTQPGQPQWSDMAALGWESCPAGKMHVRENKRFGLKTPECPTPKAAMIAARRMQEEYDARQNGAAAPAQAEETQPAVTESDLIAAHREKLAGTLAEEVVEYLNACGTLPELQQLIEEYELHELKTGEGIDPRFSAAEYEAVQGAFHRCALRLGMTFRGGAGDIPRPACDADQWRESAQAVEEKMGGQSPKRTDSQAKTHRALLALARAFDAGELPEALFGLSETAQVARLIHVKFAPTDMACDEVSRGLMRRAGITSDVTYDLARAALLTVVERFGNADADTQQPEEQAAPHADGEAQNVTPSGGLFGDMTPATMQQQMLTSKMNPAPARLVRPEGLDPDHVERLRAKLRRGEQFEAVYIYYDRATGENWLADGGHRQEAARLEGNVPLDIRLHEGTYRDALKHALRANTEHGLPRSHAGTRIAVITALLDAEWSAPSNSNTDIARMTGTSQPFVGDVQRWLLAVIPAVLEQWEDGDREGEEFDRAAGVPKGFSDLVRSLPNGRADIEALHQNVLARSEARPLPKRAEPEPEAPSLFEEQVQEAAEPPGREAVLAAPNDVAEEDGDEPPATSPALAASAVMSPAGISTASAVEESQPAVKVTDRRTFAGETPARSEDVTSTPPVEPQATATQEAPAPRTNPLIERWAAIEKRLNGRGLYVAFTILPKGIGTMYTVNVSGAPPTDALNSNVSAAGKIPYFNPEELDLIEQRLDAEKAQPKAPPSRAAKRVSPAKSAAKKSAAKKTAVKKGVSKTSTPAKRKSAAGGTKKGRSK